MDLKLFDLGLIDYPQALSRQREIFQAVYAGQLDSALITCRHYPVITMGRQIKAGNLLASKEDLQRGGVVLYQAERGGDITYHGPGQLMVYPIFRLDYFKRDIHLFLRKLEEFVIRLLGDFGVMAQTRPGLTGAWWNEQKIASIGIAIKKWITFHGLAINIKSDDLKNFSLIRPCGMDIRMTSLESALGRALEIGEVKEALKRRLEDDQSSLTGIRRGD